MTATPSDPSTASQNGGSALQDALRLDAVTSGSSVEVVSIDGDDAVSERLAASGIWAGTVLEHIASAPFGDPMLFRVHGYRLALRRSEAARVCVAEVR